MWGIQGNKQGSNPVRNKWSNLIISLDKDKISIMMITHMTEDEVEVEEDEEELLEEVDMVDMMGMVDLGTIKMMGTGAGAKVVGAEEEVGITMERDTKEAEAAKGTPAEADKATPAEAVKATPVEAMATAVLGGESAAAEGETWNKWITLKYACLISPKKIPRSSAPRFALSLCITLGFLYMY